jgi:hypothetical protein
MESANVETTSANVETTSENVVEMKSADTVTRLTWIFPNSDPTYLQYVATGIKRGKNILANQHFVKSSIFCQNI